MTETRKSNAVLRAEFWRAPEETLLPRGCVAAGLCHSVRWLVEQERAGKAPARVRIGRFALYRKRDVLRYWAPDGAGQGAVSHETEVAK
jgi:hypothetical protein